MTDASEGALVLTERRGAVALVTMNRPRYRNAQNAAMTHALDAAFTAAAADDGVKVIVLEKPPIVWPGLAEGRTAPPAERTRETMAAFADVLDAVRQGGSKLLYAEDFVYLLNHSGARMICVDRDYLGTIDGIRQRLPGVKQFIALTGERANWLSYESLLAAATDFV